MDVTYEELYENSFIWDELGRFKYYREVYPQSAKDSLKFPSYQMKSVLNLLEKIGKRNNNKNNILFLDFKFADMMRGLTDEYNLFVICNSLNEVLKQRKAFSFTGYCPNKWNKLLNESFFSHDMANALRAIKEIKKYLQDNDIRGVLLGNDKLFMEKAIIYAAKELQIHVVVIQHGAYNRDSFEKLKAAREADTFWAWSEYVSDMYREYFNKPKESSYVIGYPFNLPDIRKPKQNRVLFIGNQYAEHNKEEGDMYFDIAANVYKICKDNGLDFMYRPHPAEHIDEKYQAAFDGKISAQSLYEDFNDAHVVVGDISSAMIEAGIFGRVVVQVIWSERSREALDDPLYNFTFKTDSNSSNIEKAILGAVNDKDNTKIDKYYLDLNDDMLDRVKNQLKLYIQ